MEFELPTALAYPPRTPARRLADWAVKWGTLTAGGGLCAVALLVFFALVFGFILAMTPVAGILVAVERRRSLPFPLWKVAVTFRRCHARIRIQHPEVRD